MLATSNQQARELNSLDDNTQQTLMDIVTSGSFSKLDLYQREVIYYIYILALSKEKKLFFSFYGKSVII
jgi:hypothetical protein